MPRTTQAQRVEEGNEAQALDFFQQTLGSLPDPRRPQGVRYPLQTVVVTALMAMVCGCDDAESMELWGKMHEPWLGSMLPVPHGTPSQDVFLSVFAALDPAAFSAVLRSWANLLAVRLRATTHKHIAVDGKTSRRSFDRAHDKPALHTVSAFLSEAGLVLGQCKTRDKSNEITAIPELLQTLDLRGATVTIDAMGCQSEIAKTIVQGGGHYLLQVKDNQPTLRQQVAETFAEAADERTRALDEQARPQVEHSVDVDKGHGRLETRSVAVCRDLAWLVTSAERWPGLACVLQATRERTDLSTGKTSRETSYYIGSNPDATAAEMAHTIRRHWSIENELHWVLDMAFQEDHARHRARNTAQNMTTLRHFALNLVRRDGKRKVGIATARKSAGWDKNYLLSLLTNPVP